MSEPREDTRTLETPKGDAITELFPYELPFNAAKAIAWLVVLLFAVVTAGAFVLELPETVRCPFVLVPAEGADPVRSPFQGTLDAVNVTEGAEVDEGDVLFAVRAPEIQDWRTELDTLREELRGLAEERTLRLRDHENRMAVLEAERRQKENQVTYQRHYLAAYTDMMERMRKLSEQGLASPVEVLSQELALAGAERDVAIAEQELETTLVKRKQLDTEHERDMADLDLKETSAKVRTAALEERLDDCAEGSKPVRAPYAATVLSVARKRVGDVVALGQELCQLARRDAEPLARLSLSQAGMSRVHEGLGARLHFDAFPYQRYGVIQGTVSWVSPASVTQEGSETFVTLVSLERLAMRTGEEEKPLRVGMRGEARITVGRRSPVEYAFEPLRQLRENFGADGH